MAVLEAEHQPDIVLVDLSLKTLSGFELIKSMHILIPALPVLVVSMHDETVYAERALRAGARGYVMKQEPGGVLMAAIREVLKGNYYLSEQMRTKLLNRFVTGNAESEQLINSLTPSEFEVLHLIGSGYSSQEIARLLSRSIKTIETHRANIRAKLQLKDGADLMRYATHWITAAH
jgi:DNA-binding NarL/FixJ family response regulator